MSPDDVIYMPGTAGLFARRAVVEMWIAAGSPPVNSATRLFNEQDYFWNGWVNRLPGFNPADNPNDPSQALAHVRGVALDITPTPDRVRRLEAAGLVRPYSWESWHWQIPGNVRRFPFVINYPNMEEEKVAIKNLEVWSCPAWEAAKQRVITNGSATDTVPDGWGQSLVDNGAEFTMFKSNSDMLYAVSAVQRLNDLSESETRKKVDELTIKAGVTL